MLFLCCYHVVNVLKSYWLGFEQEKQFPFVGGHEAPNRLTEVGNIVSTKHAGDYEAKD